MEPLHKDSAGVGCNICSVRVNQSCSTSKAKNTTDLWQHLKLNHKEAFDDAVFMLTVLLIKVPCFNLVVFCFFVLNHTLGIISVRVQYISCLYQCSYFIYWPIYRLSADISDIVFL